MKKSTLTHIEPLESRIAPATLTVYNLEDQGQSSLRATIASANDGDTIVFANWMTGTIKLSSAITINKNLTIIAGYQGQVTIDGADQTNLFTIDDGDGNTLSKVSLVNLKLTNGTNTTQTGGTAISSYEDLTLNGCSISSCKSTGYAGGAISELATGGTLKLVNSSFLNNRTASMYGGGAVYMNGYGSGEFDMSGCTFQYNKATSGYGGAVFLKDIDTAAISKSGITQNQAALGGGGLYLNGVQTASITKAAVDSNTLTTTGQNGGGVLLIDSLLSVKLASVSSNSATGEGGGIYVDADSTLVTNKAGINGNNAGAEGGGIYFVGDVTALTSSFKNNHAGTDSSLTGSGGGIYGSSDSTGDLTMYYSTVKGNTAGSSYVQGGGLCLLNEGAKLVVKSLVTKNSSATGGGIYAENGSLKVVNCTITANNALNGAGIGIADGTTETIARIISSYIQGNNAYFSGGGVYSTAANDVLLIDDTINGNHAQSKANLDGEFIKI